MKKDEPWAIVLAAGDGTRLRALTTDRQGRSIPKQFCSLDGGRTLFGAALARARSVVSPDHVVAVVAAEHQHLWESEVRGLHARNVRVQPRNRGTAAGLLLPLLWVLYCDPQARIAVLPSDHHVGGEAILQVALLEALRAVHGDSIEVVLLGITPDEAVSDYGWILPERGTTRLRGVDCFVEKPRQSIARSLLARGGLWNSFLLATCGLALLGLYEMRLPDLVAAFREVDAQAGLADATALENLYVELDVQDFSRDVLQGSESRLRVLQVPWCQWTDLGTPERVAKCLRTRRAVDRAPRKTTRSTPILADALHDTDAALLSDRQVAFASAAPGAEPDLAGGRIR